LEKKPLGVGSWGTNRGRLGGNWSKKMSGVGNGDGYEHQVQKRCIHPQVEGDWGRKERTKVPRSLRWTIERSRRRRRKERGLFGGYQARWETFLSPKGVSRTGDLGCGC